MRKDPTGQQDLVDLRYHHIKSPDYKIIYGEGAYGGVTPKGMIAFTVFSERWPTPRTTGVEKTYKGTFEETPLDDSKTGIIRDLHCTIYMRAPEARKLAAWLESKAKEHDDVIRELSKEDPDSDN